MAGPKPVEMDLNVMRPTLAQKVGIAPVKPEHPVATIAERAAHFGSCVLGFSGRAAQVLDRMPR